MRSIRMFVLAMLTALSLAAMAAGGASAVQWNPQATTTGPWRGVLTFSTNTGATIRCTITFYTRASGAVATTTNSAGTNAGPVFTGCTWSISSGLAVTVTVPSAWTGSATSTSAVTESSMSATFRIGGVCTISFSGVTLLGNVWSNATHVFTWNSSSSFAISESGLCDGGTTGRFSGSITAPSTVAIS